MVKYSEVIALGDRAELIVSSEDINYVFTKLEKDICFLWVKTDSNQANTREELYRELHGLRALQRRLKQYVTDAKKAKEAVRIASTERTPSSSVFAEAGK